ncbi:MAG: phosphate/phosphite/phosphonate ABC transporter substrate-binding protein [Azonexaceae bacterium]|nr:phosphate/phosphite/phosphonate ABC transporter substrate-binding protein [Azonexaceae bacterium]
MNSFHVGKFALVLIALLFGSPAAHSAESYTFAIVPQFEQRKLFTVWQPIVDELSRRTGFNLKLVATLTVPDFEQELAKGHFDFVYANPYHIMREGTRQGYIPLVRDQQALRGILVVRKDSSYKTPAELNGEKLAIPSFNALGASLLIRADLEQVFHARTVPVDVKTHSSVYLQVANGLIPAGGGVEKTLREQDKAVQDMLRVLYTTREMPSHPIAAHPRLPAKVRLTLQRALLDLAATEEGKKLLQHVPMSEPVATSMADYAPMKKWGLEAYWVD